MCYENEAQASIGSIFLQILNVVRPISDNEKGIFYHNNEKQKEDNL